MKKPLAELRSDLKDRIGLWMGSAEDRTTEIPGVSLHRRTAPTAPCPATYEPNVTVIVQGRKRVELGSKVFIYDESRYLLTSLDQPIVSQVVEASEEVPFSLDNTSPRGSVAVRAHDFGRPKFDTRIRWAFVANFRPANNLPYA